VSEYLRATNTLLLERLRAPRRFIQVLAGPRQVGKTTAMLQVLRGLDLPNHYASADQPLTPSPVWIDEQWHLARRLHAESGRPVVLALDEIHKTPRWSSRVKALWDEDSRRHNDVRVVVLGSSPLQIDRGLSSELGGRFERIGMTHWSYRECREAFGWDLDTYCFFGGYPGAAELIHDFPRWRAYILESLIETTLTRDVLMLQRIDKPALLRQLFMLACELSGQVVSFTKLLGQLYDAGNTTTLAHYLQLLAEAGLVTGLMKYSGATVHKRGSRPKLLVLNTALMTAVHGARFEEAKADGPWWGRLIESAAGGHLLRSTQAKGGSLFYWSQGDAEVDFVLERGGAVTAVEVKAGRIDKLHRGMQLFSDKYSPQTTVLIGEGGLDLESMLSADML
jgi:predicted AAA+ superfamily ATPase